jgi:hypothetical protein
MSTSRFNALVDTLVDDDIEFFYSDPDGRGALYFLLVEGHEGYSTATLEDLEIEVRNRGLEVSDEDL